MVGVERMGYKPRRISFRDLLYSIVPVVNNMLLYTLKYAERIDLTLSILTTKQNKREQNTNKQKRNKEKIWSRWIYLVS